MYQGDGSNYDQHSCDGACGGDGQQPDMYPGDIASVLTLSWLLRNLMTRRPATLEVCTLLRKPDAIQIDVPVRYIGFDIPQEFVVGYGLDYGERYRDLPYIGTLAPEVYAD